MRNAIAFPFVRGKLSPIEALDEFLQTIVNARKLDPNLSAAERDRTVPWAKCWWEELHPIKIFAEHNELPAGTQYALMPEGDAVDVQIHAGDAVTRFQITMAYPDWDEANASRRNPGYVRHLERAGINQGAAVFGGGDIAKNASGTIESQPKARGPEVDRAAWQSGLRKALNAKLLKGSQYVGKVDVLLISTEQLKFDTIDDDTASFVLSDDKNNYRRGWH